MMNSNNSNTTKIERRAHDCHGYLLVGLLLASTCSSSPFLVDAARVMVPSFRLVPRTSPAPSTTEGGGPAAVSFGQSAAVTSATFDCTTDVADLISATVDDCLKLSTVCLMSALFGSGQECAVSPDGGDDSVILQPGFLDVASVGLTGAAIDSTNIETECLKPTLESSRCLAIMQQRLNGRANLVQIEYISLADTNTNTETSQPAEETPPPVKIPLTTPAPVNAPTVAPITSAPSTSVPFSDPTAIPSVASAPVTVASITDAPSTSAPTVSTSSEPTTQLDVEAAFTGAPTIVPVEEDDEEDTDEDDDTQTAKDEGDTDPNTNTSKNQDDLNSPYSQDAQSPNQDEYNTMVIVGSAVVGAGILLCLLLCFAFSASRNTSRSNDRTTTSTRAAVDAAHASRGNETVSTPPPQAIDIEKGHAIEDTEGDTSESSNHQRQGEEHDNASPHPRQQSHYHDLHVSDGDCSEVPENDEILSTGSSSDYSLESGASSSLYSGRTGGTSAYDTTDLDFDEETFKSIHSSELMGTIQAAMQQHSEQAPPSDDDDDDQSHNDIANARDISSVASESSIESDDPDQRAAQQVQPSAWLTRSDRLVTAAQTAAAAMAPPATSQADF